MIGDLCDLAQEKFHGGLQLAFVDQSLYPLRSARGDRGDARRDRRLVENEATDPVGQESPLETAEPSERVPEQEDRLSDRLSDCLHHGSHVLRLSDQLMMRSISALAPPSPVHGADGDTLLEIRRNSEPTTVIGRRAVHEEQRRPVTTFQIRDDGTVL